MSILFLNKMTETLNKSLDRYGDALTYLTSRGVDREDITKYSIGYSKVINVPEDNSDDRVRFMAECHKGRDFENMIIFPIKDQMGQVIGIVGRKMDIKQYKIFFSDEAKFTGCFFGFYEALPYIYKSRAAYLTEGPFDCVPLRKVLPNTISSLTAKINEEQYELLNFYCDNIITVFDSDKRGRAGHENISKKWSNIHSMDLGFKDPNLCYQHFGSIKPFRDYVMKRVNNILL